MYISFQVLFLYLPAEHSTYNFNFFSSSTVNHETQYLVELYGMLPDEAGVSNHAEQTGCSFDTNITGFRVKIAVILSLLWHKSTLRIVCLFCFFVFLLRVCLQVDQINYYYVMQVQLRESLARYIFLKRCCLFEFLRKRLSIMIEHSFPHTSERKRLSLSSGMAVTIKISSWKE